MNSIERMTLTLQHKEADRVPVYPLINSVSRKALGISYEEWTKDIDKCAEAIIRTTDEIGVDAMCTLVDLSIETEAWGQELIYFEDKAACPNPNNHRIQDEEGYLTLPRVELKDAKRLMEHVELARKLYEARGHEKPVIGFVLGPLAILGNLRGMEDLFVDMLTEPEYVKKALETITYTVKQFVSELIDAGCCAIMFDTLFAAQSIMSKEMWDEFEGPFAQELAEVVREKGAMVMIHNCGAGVYFDVQYKRMQPVLFSYNLIPDDCKDMKDIKEKYGDKMTLMGHIDPAWLYNSTEEELRKLCREQIDTYKKDGGFVLATGCEYPAPLDFRKAKIMVEEACTYGKYEKELVCEEVL